MKTLVAIAFLGVTSPSGYLWFAFAGSALAAALVYAVSSIGREGATPVKLALAGAAVSAALGSLITAVMLTSRVSLDQMRFWQVGSLAGRGFGILWQILPTLVVGAAIALALGRLLNGLALGDDVARGLGQRVGVTRVLCGVAIVLLCELVLDVGAYRAGVMELGTPDGSATPVMGVSNIKAIGALLYGRYLFLFEAAGLILLVAMIGAIVLTHRQRSDTRGQNIARQIARRPDEATVNTKPEVGKGVQL